jgi:hypothetical protein
MPAQVDDARASNFLLAISCLRAARFAMKSSRRRRLNIARSAPRALGRMFSCAARHLLSEHTWTWLGNYRHNALSSSSHLDSYEVRR